MPNRSSFIAPLCVSAGLAVAFIAAGQDAPAQFTARELFYAGDPAAPKSTPKAPSKAPAVTPPKRPANTQVAASSPKPPATPARTSTAVAPPTQTAMATSPDGSPIIRVSDGHPATAPAPVNGPALGMKITILKQSGSDYVEVPPDMVFHAGDKLQFSVQTNSPGYLYIVNQGSSGTWKPIFPSPEVADGDNHVDGWHAYTMPPKSRVVFDEQVGTEKLFIVFSREPEPEFENMIYSLPGANGKTLTPAQPASQPAAAPKRQKEMVISANLNIQDSAVSQFRQTYSRDLIIEKVDDKTPNDKSGDKKEKAVYIVNATGSADSRVVADLRLAHQ
jgi:hypothetical protein